MRIRAHILAAAAVSGLMHAFALTGTAYMLLIYERVLPERSATALAVLTAAMLALYAAGAGCDLLRLRIVQGLARQIDEALAPAIDAASARRVNPRRDLDQLRAFLAGSGPGLILDGPFLPLYMAMIYLLHPWLGAFATASLLLLLAVPTIVQKFVRTGATTVRAQGRAGRQANVRMVVLKAARQAVQSGILGLGAYLVINGKTSATTMMAASFVLARALPPIESAIAGWDNVLAAYASFLRVCALLREARQPPATACCSARPESTFRAAELSVIPPCSSVAVVRNVSFALRAGDGLGIIGACGSGKSCLARTLAGSWAPHGGTLLLDERPLREWTGLSRHVGYLPQNARLFAGTLAANIASRASADMAAIEAAARLAGAYDAISRLPQCYATPIGADGAPLSAGQRQRVALARALFGEPFLVVLDEPDANLDPDGVRAVISAIASVRRRGGIAIVVTHRQSVLAAADQVLALAHGQVASVGPRGAVLAKVARPLAPSLRDGAAV